MRTLSLGNIYSKNNLTRRIQSRLADKNVEPFEIHLNKAESYRFGTGPAKFSIYVNDVKAIAALSHFDELRFSEAYFYGDFDIKGDMWAVFTNRALLHDIHPLYRYWRRVLPFLTGQAINNKHAIADHYEFDNEFFIKFMGPTRSYSQALYESEDESLEMAQQRKLANVVKTLDLKPGARVLDVGGGWGAFLEHAGKQDIQVTAITLARQSEAYLKDLVARLQIPCKVSFGDFYQYESNKPYDAIVILGVIEHLPNYKKVVSKISQLLKPGGKVYLDASSFREIYSKPTFISRYVFPGNHRYFCLHDFLATVATTNLELRSVHNDRYSYYLTCKAWAMNLESAQHEIVHRWGEKLYRIFRLYLWGSAYAFYSRSMDAYRVVLERPDN